MTDEGTPLDLSGLQMAPDWVSKLDEGSVADLTKRYGGGPGRGDDRDWGRGGPGRGKGKGKGKGPPRERGGDRRGKPGSGFGPGGRERDRERGKGGGRREGRPGSGPRRRGGGPDDRKFGERPRREGPAPVPGLAATIRPGASNVSALADMIKRSGRTFALIDLAKLFLAARDRYEVGLAPGEGNYGGPGSRGGKGKKKKKPKQPAPGQNPTGEPAGAAGTGPGKTPPPRLHVCQSDGSVWLTKDEAVRHLVGTDVIAEHYGVEEVSVDPPKGNFAGIAVCGISGELLGPPNHHSYQERLMALYRERFSHLPIERYKQKVTVETGEEVVERWKAAQSTRSEWIYPKPATVEAAPPEQEQEQEQEPAATDSTEGEAASETAGGDAPDSNTDTGSDADTDTADPAAPAAAAGQTTEDGGASTTTDAGTEAGTEAEAAPGEAETTGGDSPPDADATTDADADAGTPGAPPEPEPEPVAGAAASDTGESVVRLTTRAELERHFREHLADSLIVETERVVVPGNIPGKRLSPGLLAHLKSAGEHAQRSPSMLIAPLCDALGTHGLKFFRWGGGKHLYAAAHRPRQLDLTTALSAQVRAIFEFVRAHPNAKPQALLDELAPTPAPGPEAAPATESAPAAAPGPPAGADTPAPAATAAGTGESVTPAEAPKTAESGAAAAAPEPTPPPKPAAAPDLTDAQVSVLRDLRWLVAEGYIVEFADGRLDAVKVREPKPAPDPKPAPAPSPTVGSKTGEAAAPDPSAADPTGTAAASSPDAPSAPTEAAPPAGAPDPGGAGPEKALEQPGAPTPASGETDSSAPAPGGEPGAG